MIYSYVRDKDRCRIGVVVALNRETLGWSLCHKGLDKFDRDLGLKIAVGRAEKGSYVSIPACVKPTISKVQERAKRYFK